MIYIKFSNLVSIIYSGGGGVERVEKFPASLPPGDLCCCGRTWYNVEAKVLTWSRSEDQCGVVESRGGGEVENRKLCCDVLPGAWTSRASLAASVEPHDTPCPCPPLYRVVKHIIAAKTLTVI